MGGSPSHLFQRAMSQIVFCLHPFSPNLIERRDFSALTQQHYLPWPLLPIAFEKLKRSRNAIQTSECKCFGMQIVTHPITSLAQLYCHVESATKYAIMNSTTLNSTDETPNIPHDTSELINMPTPTKTILHLRCSITKHNQTDANSTPA